MVSTQPPNVAAALANAIYHAHVALDLLPKPSESGWSGPAGDEYRGRLSRIRMHIEALVVELKREQHRA